MERNVENRVTWSDVAIFFWKKNGEGALGGGEGV